MRWREALAAVMLAGAAAAAGCGYSSARVPADTSGYCVQGVDDPLVDSQARAALEDGVRGELGRRGLLESCSSGRVLVVRFLRVHDAPAAMVADGDEVLARGQRVRVEAEAVVESSTGSEASFWAEGEVEVAPGQAALLQALAQRSARQEAARRCGARLARRVMGDPVAETLR